MLKKIYFPNLNSLRFIAASFVILCHIDGYRVVFGEKKVINHPINKAGELGVVLFFVLSGFLITYLLLNEKVVSKGVSIKKFYLKRILRIWPLYFLIVFLGFFVWNKIDFLNIPDRTHLLNNNFYIKLSLFLAILPNIALKLFPPIAFTAQTWSIGVEEQFYLIWPHLINKFKNAYATLIAAIGFYLLVKFIFIQLIQNEVLIFDKILSIWNVININSMAIGGLAAAVLFEKNKFLLKLLFHKSTQIIVYTLAITCIYKGFKFPYYLDIEFYSGLFAVIIINLAGNPKTIINLENPILSYLGKISYGIYMFHILTIVIALKLFNFNMAMVYPFVFLTSIAISSISYHFFESKFTRLNIGRLPGDSSKIKEQKVSIYQ